MLPVGRTIFNSVAPAVLSHSKAELSEPWKPEAQARGWRTPRIALARLLAAPQAPSSPHCAALQPLARTSGFLTFRTIGRPGGASSDELLPAATFRNCSLHYCSLFKPGSAFKLGGSKYPLPLVSTKIGLVKEKDLKLEKGGAHLRSEVAMSRY